MGQPPYKPAIDSTEHRAAQVLYDKAVKTLEIARAADPKDNETLQRLLKGYVESNRIEPAVREFEKVVAGDTTNNKTNRFILGVLYRTIGRYDEAIGQFKEANKMDPNDCEVLFDIAATYYNWGVDMIRISDEKNEQSDAYKAKFQAALPYMEKVAECKKDDVNVWETMGTIYARLGQQDKAMKAFDQADKIRKGAK
jgi:tetratricopeptide (TPR) repeat protein